MKSFHRVFLCALCRRVIAGCFCGPGYVEELIHSCAICSRKPSKLADTQ